MGEGTEDRAEGTWDKAKGKLKLKETAGEATGDRDMEREGRMDQAKGAGKRALGNVRRHPQGQGGAGGRRGQPR